MLAPRTALPALTDRLPLGTTGLVVSPICSGMTYDARVVPAAFEAGINFFFLTADMHWPIYEATRQGLADLLRGHPSRRDEIVVACASYVTQPEFCFAPFDEVLAAVPALGRLDLTIAGGSYGHELAARIEMYKVHKVTGHAGARGIGASFHDRDAAREHLASGALDIQYVRYNPCHPGAREDLFPHVCARAAGRTTLLYNFKSTDSWVESDARYAALGVGAVNWKPHITDYYRFALTTPALDGILCGMPSPDGIVELADALAKGPLDDEDHQYLIELGILEKRHREVERRRRIADAVRET